MTHAMLLIQVEIKDLTTLGIVYSSYRRQIKHVTKSKKKEFIVVDEIWIKSRLPSYKKKTTKSPKK